MSEDNQLKVMWQKLDGHTKDISKLHERSGVLEHRANTVDHRIEKLFVQQAESDTRTQKHLSDLNTSIQKVIGGKDMARWIVSLVISLLAISLAYVQFFEGG